jgi:hypothetical protein
VPRISAFYGIVIEMYFGDHAPPHFHARYSGDEATIVIATGEILDGSLPPRALRLVREWLSEHREELAENFELASAMQALRPVAPLP